MSILSCCSSAAGSSLIAADRDFYYRVIFKSASPPNVPPDPLCEPAAVRDSPACAEPHLGRSRLTSFPAGCSPEVFVEQVKHVNQQQVRVEE